MSECIERVNRGHGRYNHYEACGREVVEDGLCKLHLRVRENRRRKDEEMRAGWDRDERLKTEAEKLSAALGTTVHANYEPYRIKGGGYDGRFVVSGDWLRGVARERGGA